MSIYLKEICCPQCTRKVMKVDMKATNSFSVRCKKCNILVTYNGRTGMTDKNKIPTRITASGVRFY